MVDLKPGDVAPNFELESTDGTVYSLKEFNGKKRVVLYFYPKDNTPGCTKEACSFRDNKDSFDAEDTVIFGVSKDSLKSHQNFTDKFELNFPLLSDPEHVVAEAYGAWGEKKNYGKTYMGMIRKTFVIGKDGKLEHVFHKVKADGHGEEILNLIK